MDFEQAQSAFRDLLNNISQEDKANFLMWIKSVVSVTDCSGQGSALARRKLRNISQDIKSSELLPADSIFPSEHVLSPTSRKDADCSEVHVDAFLYDEIDLDELVEQGRFSRNYCRDCKSRNIAPLNFITHSASLDRVAFIFESLLPHQSNSTILDVGSRLGAVLYGAYVFTEASRIVGVEMNGDLCALQRAVVEKHGMADRIQVICDDICNLPELVREAHVVILNNVFQFFLLPEKQRHTWAFLYANIRRTGSILVTVPSLQSTWQHLQLEPQLQLKKWVREVDSARLLADQDDELSEIHLYCVL